MSGLYSAELGPLIRSTLKIAIEFGGNPPTFLQSVFMQYVHGTSHGDKGLEPIFGLLTLVLKLKSSGYAPFYKVLTSSTAKIAKPPSVLLYQLGPIHHYLQPFFQQSLRAQQVPNMHKHCVNFWGAITLNKLSLSPQVALIPQKDNFTPTPSNMLF